MSKSSFRRFSDMRTLSPSEKESLSRWISAGDNLAERSVLAFSPDRAGNKLRNELLTGNSQRRLS